MAVLGGIGAIVANNGAVQVAVAQNAEPLAEAVVQVAWAFGWLRDTSDPRVEALFMLALTVGGVAGTAKSLPAQPLDVTKPVRFGGPVKVAPPATTGAA